MSAFGGKADEISTITDIGLPSGRRVTRPPRSFGPGLFLCRGIGPERAGQGSQHPAVLGLE